MARLLLAPKIDHHGGVSDGGGDVGRGVGGGSGSFLVGAKRCTNVRQHQDAKVQGHPPIQPTFIPITTLAL